MTIVTFPPPFLLFLFLQRPPVAPTHVDDTPAMAEPVDVPSPIRGPKRRLKSINTPPGRRVFRRARRWLSTFL